MVFGSSCGRVCSGLYGLQLYVQRQNVDWRKGKGSWLKEPFLFTSFHSVAGRHQALKTRTRQKQGVLFVPPG